MADLWIKTQAKNQLLKVDNVERNGLYISTYMHNTTIELGYYNPEERAIEVMNEIQKLLMTVDTLVVENFDLTEKNIEDFKNNKVDILPFKTEDNPKLYYINKSCIVYEMPEE